MLKVRPMVVLLVKVRPVVVPGVVPVVVLLVKVRPVVATGVVPVVVLLVKVCPVVVPAEHKIRKIFGHGKEDRQKIKII